MNIPSPSSPPPTSQRHGWLAVIGAFIVVGGGIFIYSYFWGNQAALQKEGAVNREYSSQTIDNVDFKKVSQNFENFLQENAGSLSPYSEAVNKIRWADSLSEVDRKKGTEILKEIIVSQKYPDEVKAYAINYLVNDYELDFIDHDFAKAQIFTGPIFEKIFMESQHDVDLGVRKLNEMSHTFFPNITASYRIAKWYASELEKGSLPAAARRQHEAAAQEYLAIGDELLQKARGTITPQREGLAYELKARTLDMLGREKEAEEYFRLSIRTLVTQPRTVFQDVYLSRSALYFAAFLARQYEAREFADIKNLLDPIIIFIEAPAEPKKRNVRLVSRIIAARDSQSPHYPSTDFTKADIERLGSIYPKWKDFVERLNLREYVKGHPLEAEVKSL